MYIHDQSEKLKVIRVLVICFIIVFSVTTLKDCKGTSWLFWDTDKKQQEIEQLEKDVKDAVEVNENNQKQQEIKEEVAKKTEEVRKDVDTKIKDITKKRESKKKIYDKKVVDIEKSDIPEEEKVKKVIEASADNIWDTYCAINPEGCDDD